MEHKTLAARLAESALGLQGKEPDIVLETCREFLSELANLQISRPAVDRLIRKFPHFLPETILTRANLRAWMRASEIPKKLITDVAKQFNVKATVAPRYSVPLILSRSYLRAIWDAPDIWTAEWKLFWLRLTYKQVVEPGSSPLEPPLPTPFEIALLYLYRNLHRARRCTNQACVAPYFIAADKKGRQTNCGNDVCTREAQKEYKRRWWSEKGSEQRRRMHR